MGGERRSCAGDPKKIRSNKRDGRSNLKKKKHCAEADGPPWPLPPRPPPSPLHGNACKRWRWVTLGGSPGARSNLVRGTAGREGAPREGRGPGRGRAGVLGRGCGVGPSGGGGGGALGKNLRGAVGRGGGCQGIGRVVMDSCLLTSLCCRACGPSIDPPPVFRPNGPLAHRGAEVADTLAPAAVATHAEAARGGGGGGSGGGGSGGGGGPVLEKGGRKVVPGRALRGAGVAQQPRAEAAVVLEGQPAPKGLAALHAAGQRLGWEGEGGGEVERRGERGESWFFKKWQREEGGRRKRCIAKKQIYIIGVGASIAEGRGR